MISMGVSRASLFAESREGRLVAGVDGSSVLAAATASAAEVTSTASVTTTIATLTTSASPATTAATSTTSARALRLDEAGIEVDGLLGLALTFALGLAGRAGDVVLLLLLERLSGGPLLVELAALVGLTDLEAGVKSSLLLGLLGKVLCVRDVLLLGLGGFFASGILNEGVLLLGLGNGLTSLLVLQLSVTLSGAPRLGSLLVGAGMNTCPGGVSVILLTGAAAASATTNTGAIAATGAVLRGLLGGSALVAIAASTTVSECTLASTGTSSVATSTSGSNGSLGFNSALRGAQSFLVYRLDGDNGLLLAITVVT